MCSALSIIYLLQWRLCGSMIALDLQQKLKPFLHSSQDQMTMRFFLGIYNSFMYFRKSPR